MSNIHEFFEDYAVASIKGNPKVIAAFYSKNFIAVGPNESMVFANDENFLKWLKGVFNFNATSGLEKMLVRNISSHAVGKNVTQATVTWGAIYTKTKEEIIEFDIHYILEKFGSGLKIILYISDEDQEELKIN